MTGRGACVPILTAWMVCACMAPDRIDRARSDGVAMQAKVVAAHHGLKSNITDASRRRAAQDVQRPWLAGPSQPLAREVILPAALRADVDTTLMFAGGQTDLTVLADRISRATGILVRVQPEAMLPLENFLPRLATAAMPARALPRQAELREGSQPLAKVLDRLAARLGVYWRYADEAVEFYRTQTRIFEVRALALAAQADARLGRSSDSSEGGFANSATTTLSAPKHDTLKAIRARLTPFLTQAGVIAADPGAGSSIVVTDTPPALRAIQHFLQGENRALTRRVRLIFEEITVIASDEALAGIDWKWIYAGSRAAASIAVPGAAHAAQAAALLTGGAVTGPAQGSSFILSALRSVGTVVRHVSVPLLTLNRRPVTHAMRHTFSYVDQIQALQAGGPENAVKAWPATTSINQKRETVGSFLTLLPEVQDDGQILLSLAYDSSDAQPLKTIVVGKNALQVQQIAIDGQGTVQQVALQPGQPLLIAGFDNTQDDASRRRLGDGIPLIAGGSDRLAQARTSTLVLVTAQVEEDA